MSIQALGSEDYRRIFRDFLKGAPKSKAMKKYSLTEDEYWSVIEMYHKPRGYKNAREQAKAKAAAKAPKAEEVSKAPALAKEGAKVLTITKPGETKP